MFSVHFQYFHLKRHCETKLSPGGGVSKMSVIPFCIDFCAFSTLLCGNPPIEHFVSKLTGALSPGGGGSKLSIFPFCIDFCAFSTLSCETPQKVHFVSKLTGMSNFERNPLVYHKEGMRMLFNIGIE